jgi:hypothetical protein
VLAAAQQRLRRARNPRKIQAPKPRRSPQRANSAEPIPRAALARTGKIHYIACKLAPNNGADNGKTWYGNFDMTQFTFINTSGGSTEAPNTKIRGANAMTWAGVSSVTGKPILADTGYGANGVSAGADPNWDSVTNINARMKDGVVGICQYNPSSTWATTISGIRSQLGTPKFCP